MARLDDQRAVYLDPDKSRKQDWQVVLENGTTSPPINVDRFGNRGGDNLYNGDGTRRPMVDELGNPVQIYREGKAIPLYDWWGKLVTRGERDPERPDDDDPSTPTKPDEDNTPGTVDEGTGLVPVSELMEFMQGDPVAPEVARIAIEGAGAMVAAYCRGRHVDRLGNPRPGVSAVVITAAARIAANPGQVSRTDRAGNFTRIRGEGFSGFTLAEQQVLNRYRKRAR